MLAAAWLLLVGMLEVVPQPLLLLLLLLRIAAECNPSAKLSCKA
jgi:hypothetical protein